jgi:hypothetical protein
VAFPKKYTHPSALPSVAQLFFRKRTAASAAAMFALSRGSDVNNLYETRNKAKCVPYSPAQHREEENGHTYILMQMLPAHPQRFEWIRKDNLRCLDDEAQTG